MSSKVKIIFIVAIFLLSVLLVVLFIIPNLSASIRTNAAIEKERENNKAFNETLKELLLLRDRYYSLNAEYQKYSLQLPSENDISVFTDEIYDIAKYSNVAIYSIDYSEKTSATDEGKKKPEETIIKADIILQGSYYNIINFIKAIERAPRIVTIEDVIIQSTEDEYENLSAYITAQLYYKS